MLVFSLAEFIFSLILFKAVIFSDSIHLFSHLSFLNFLISDSNLWSATKSVFLLSNLISSFVIFNFIFSFLKSHNKQIVKDNAPTFGLLLGIDDNHNKVYLPESGLYQNMLITGTIGSGKTASALYPFTKQLMSYESISGNSKLSFLILDVKGNYYSKVLEFADKFNRSDDVIVIQLGGNYFYNPLDKPFLEPSVLANRLKTILLLFSPNNSESYWLDKAEQVIESCINICRVYNYGYVTFEELHKLVSNYDYLRSKFSIIRNIFLAGNLDESVIFNLCNSITFLENDYFSLDSRTFNILKSEITRITYCFVSNYNVKRTFCPKRKDINFKGFDDALKSGKIVVLNMNIAQYKNLSKIIATYLKLDFQTDVLKQLSNSISSENIRPSVFISDEYQEYVTSSDADFFAQSRESKCISIVATQSYTSILNAINNQNAAKVIIQNLVNKLWFRSDDIFTIEDIQKQIGKIEKERFSKTFSENSKQSSYNYILKNFVSIDSNISESVNSYSQLDYAFDYHFFTQELETFQSLAFISDGSKIIKPSKLHMIPYFMKEDYIDK